MRSKVKARKTEIKEKALASHFFNFLCHPTFGTFTKSHRLMQNLNFVKEPNLAYALQTKTKIEMVL